MNSTDSRLRGLLATLTLVAFMGGVPVVLIVIDALPDPNTFTWSRLTAQDDGTLALQVITAVCWIAWAVFTCQLLASIVSQARGVRTPRLTGLTVPQLAADRLVAAAALLFVAVPTVSAAIPQPRAHAAVAAPMAQEPQMAYAVEAPAEPQAEDQVRAVQPETECYTVKRGDSLWKIAEDRLGDGTRYVELVALNEAVLDGRPDFLLPGTVLKVPLADDSSDGSYVVRPGDTLSEISQDQLGDADAYPSIFRASRDTVQPNGAHISDPDLILPGWKLTIPGEPAPTEPQKPQHAQDPPVDETIPPTDSATPPAPEAVDSAPRRLPPNLPRTRSPRVGCSLDWPAPEHFWLGRSGWCSGSTGVHSCAIAGPAGSSRHRQTSCSRSRSRRRCRDPSPPTRSKNSMQPSGASTLHLACSPSVSRRAGSS